VSVSTEQQSPPPGRGRIKREHLQWAAAGLVVLVLGFALAAMVAERRVNNKEKAQLLGQQNDSGGTVAGVGPLDGTDLSQYISERQTALGKASGERVAVVSLSGYVTADQARTTAGGLEIVALLAAPPGDAPSEVTGDMQSWAQQQKQQAATDRDQTQELLKNGVDDPDYKAFYQSEVARLTKLMAAIDPNGLVIFGVVVRGQAAELQALAQKPGVRLVDVGPSAKTTDRTTYTGIRPDQSGSADQHTPRSF